LKRFCNLDRPLPPLPCGVATCGFQFFFLIYSHALLHSINIAGHCPHDELPDEVNALIHDWLRCSASEPATETADLVTFSHDEIVVKDESELMKADWFSYFSQ
jgi:hypothetical protein